LTDVKSTADSSGILLSRLDVNKDLLGLYNTAWLALVEDTKHLGPDLEFPAMRCGWERLVKLNLALSIDDAAGIELWHAGDRTSCRSRIEIYYFLVGVLEWEDDWVSRKGRKAWMKFIEEVELVIGATYAIGEEKHIAL
jgi:hypothetical protein